MKREMMKTECQFTHLGRTISFRPIEVESDLPILHNWMHQKHIKPFWKLDLPMEDLHTWLTNSTQASHKDVYMGYVDDEPVCYLIAYDIKEDAIKNYYDPEPGDLGMHLLIGPREYLNPTDGEAIILAMGYYLFNKYGAKRIIGEPDVRNRIILPIIKRFGANILKEIELPNKKAKLVAMEQKTLLNYCSEFNTSATLNIGDAKKLCEGTITNDSH
ncbi:GNAT family N-acetyltransferase [Alkalihalobacillus sp. CinArs1]|uniref:GNAT family N-acetyltransferase n=1 Tax=Alkalihalobacillus sp. CinArs1 TaxID=2995314 RepID=UPI0022DD2B9D|nr:GNAT family N-acetyltransferase [Alkalihalobacillus sp. CinArs1]